MILKTIIADTPDKEIEFIVNKNFIFFEAYIFHYPEYGFTQLKYILQHEDYINLVRPLEIREGEISILPKSNSKETKLKEVQREIKKLVGGKLIQWITTESFIYKGILRGDKVFNGYTPFQMEYELLYKK